MERAEFGDSRERIWWYVRQSIVEGNDNGVYFLNLRLPEGMTSEAWQQLAAVDRYECMMELMDETYEDPEAFKRGPRSWNSRW